jgi:hypothetical protein
MMYREIIALCSKNRTIYVNAFVFKNVEGLKDERLFFVPDFSCEIF